MREFSNSKLDWFSFEFRKVIGFVLIAFRGGFKNSRQFFIQSEVKSKPIVTRSFSFFRASRQLRDLHVITSNFDWFAVSLVTGYSDYFYGTRFKTAPMKSSFVLCFDYASSIFCGASYAVGSSKLDTRAKIHVRGWKNNKNISPSLCSSIFEYLRYLKWVS